jgi:mono/diheme cytochrome c family protein
MRLAATAAGLACIAAAALLAPRRDAAAEGADETPGRDVGAFLSKWCFECHSGAKPEGELDLAKLAASPDAEDASDAWREVRRRLKRREMPPKKAPQPPVADAAKVIDWIDARPSAAREVDPGRVTLRRLSRFEYRRTIRDLLGVDVDVESRLPADEVTLGFDNVGDAMSLSPALLEKYVAVAEEIAPLAIVDAGAEKKIQNRLEPEKTGWIEFFADGSAGTEIEFPREGDYRFRVRAYGQQSGPDPVRMAFRADGAVSEFVDVKAKSDLPEIYEARLRIPAGKRRASVAFVNEYNKLHHPEPENIVRKLFVQWIEVTGPVDHAPLPALQRALFGDDPGRPRDRAYVEEIVRKLATRTFRRPVDDEEARRYADVVAAAQKRGQTLERGVQIALSAMLASPNFLFRVETDPTDAAHDLADHELATRLSYFLWSSMPDDELSALAAKGALRTPDDVAAQARRMLRDARASALVSNFAAQWLELRRLEAVAPDPDRFPQFDAPLRAAMRQETDLFLEALIRENRPLREFLDADFTFVNERLARHYGIVGVKGERMQRVSLRRGARGGLLAQASVLTLTSNPTRTSPVKRGKFILTEILGEPPAPPPPGVGTFDESEAASKAASLRQRLERHRSDPNCVGCHTRMDALGFPLENFDAVGAWRELDAGRPVDAIGTLPDGREIKGVADLRATLVADDAFLRCLAEKLLVYALGRAPTPADRRALDRLAASLPGLDATFADVVTEIVKTDGFRRRRGEAR